MNFYSQLCRYETLAESWEKVRKIKDKSLPDPWEKESYETHPEVRLRDLQGRLVNKTYKPYPIKRFLKKKPNGKDRFLHLLSFEDRIVQNAINSLLYPLTEQIFLPRSYAFRLGKSYLDLIKEMYAEISRGYTLGLKTDIASFFDEIDHDILLKFLGYYVGDRDFSGLIMLYLKNWIQAGNRVFRLAKGVPQGMNIAPILSNLYLHPLDLALSKKRMFFRYADDLLFLCASIAEANDALSELQGLLKTLRLKLKRESIALVDFNKGFEHLGFYIRSDTCYPLKTAA